MPCPLVQHRRLRDYWVGAVALTLFGCGADESSTQPPVVASSLGTDAKGNTLVVAQIKSSDKPPTGESTTPSRKIDPKEVVDVVKGDIKGGEAASGGTPESYLWQMPDASQIKDEPYTPALPKGFPLIAALIPPSNPLTKGRVELGKQLYFDARVSLDGTVSCATCHNPAKGWTDQLKTSQGIDGQVGGRNAPTVLNTILGRTMFWDGRAPSLEGQSQGPPQNPIEMGKQSYKQIIDRLRAIPGYKEQFLKVFGTDVTLDGFAKAIAAFERTHALSGNSAYDKYTGGDNAALTDSQKRGMVLFGLRLSPDDEFRAGVTLKKADCTSCHVGYNFTDEQFHNLGIGWNESEKTFLDLGRFVIDSVGAKNVADLGSFKTPTVRDAVNTPPYMHDGSLKTLEEVVEHYNKGGNPNPTLDKDIKKLNLTDQEKGDVVAFMKALTGEPLKIVLPSLPKDKDGKAPSPADALVPPTKKTAWNDALHPMAR